MKNTNIRHPRALVAMAHPVRRHRLTRGLREDGWTVVAVEDGYKLVRRLADAILDEDTGHRPDLIIADATMAGCSGLTVLEGLRDLHWNTPIIVIVDFNRPDTLRLATNLGATAVFEKPIDVDEVRAAVARLRSTEGLERGPTAPLAVPAPRR
jgi:CheY-like chemotaxis protein